MDTSRLKHLSVEDNISFRYNNDVMRRCFNAGGNTEYFRRAAKSTGDGCHAWFPKERQWINGGWRSGSNDANWKNHIEDNGHVIIMELNEDEMPSPITTKEPHIAGAEPYYTFWKETAKAPYRYIGTYLVDVNASKPRRQVFRRIGTEIDLSPWYDRINLEYLQNDGKGRDVFKNIYIKGKYEKQKRYVDAFLQRIDIYIEKEAHYLDISYRVSNSFSLARIRMLTEADFIDYVYLLQNYAEELFKGGKKSLESKMNELGIQNMAWSIVDLISNKDHNTALRETQLDGEGAGGVLALYDPQCYIYSLPESLTDYYLKKLKIYVSEQNDLTEKHCLLYFWKQCNAEMENWSPFLFVCFLEDVFGYPPQISK